MATTTVERIVVGLGFSVDEPSVKKGLAAYDSIAAAAEGVAAAIGTALLASATFTISMAEQVAATQDLANSLSLTTEEYTALAYAADMSGISQEKMKVGLMTLQRQLGAAGRGSKEAGALFSKLGVSVEDSNGNLKTSSAVLLEVADGIQQLGSDGEKSAVLLQLFGESGGAFKDLFKDGAKGVKALTDQAVELGIVLDSDVAEAGAQLDDSFLSLKKVVGALGLAFADDLFPPMKVLVEQLTAFLADSDGIVRSGIERAAKAIGKAFEFLATDAGKAAFGIGTVATALSAARTAQGAAGLLGSLGPAGQAVSGLTAAFASSAKAVGPYVIALAGLYLAYDELKVTAEGGDSMIRRFGQTLGIETETVKLATNTFNLLGNAFDSAMMFASEAEKSISQSIRGIAAALDIELPEEWSALGAVFDRLASNISRAVQGFQKLQLYMSGDTGIETTPFGEAALSVPSAQGYVINSARERNTNSYGAIDPAKERAAMQQNVLDYYAERGVVNAQGERVAYPAVNAPVTINVSRGDSKQDILKQVEAGLNQVEGLR